jgi:lactoylglutathione lyase
MPLRGFGSLPGVQNGRHQPIDSLARNSLLLLRKKQTLNTEPWKGEFGGPKIISATAWLAELMFDAAAADQQPCFRIDNADVIGLLGLPAGKSEAGRTDGKHYAWNQIAPGMTRLKAEVSRASEIKEDLRTAYDKGLVNLWEGLSLYQTLRAGVGPAAVGRSVNTYTPRHITKGKLMKVGYVVLYVADEAACLQFWTEQVGMVEKDRKSVGEFDIVKVGFTDQSFNFELVPLDLMKDNPDGLDLATPSLAFHVDDLAVTREALVAAGVQATELGNHSGVDAFAFSDNEGRWFAVTRS